MTDGGGKISNKNIFRPFAILTPQPLVPGPRARTSTMLSKSECERSKTVRSRDAGRAAIRLIVAPGDGTDTSKSEDVDVDEDDESFCAETVLVSCCII